MWSKIKIFSGKIIALRILVGLARGNRRQIGNTGIGWCNRRPLEKITPFKFGLFSAEGSHFHQSGRVPFSPIRKGPIFTNPEGSHFHQSGSVLLSLIWKVPNPEGSHFHLSGRVLLLAIRKVPIFANPEGS